MRSHDLKPERMTGVVFDHGGYIFTTLVEACRTCRIKQGYIPMFIAG